MAQSVKRLTLDFGSGHDLVVQSLAWGSWVAQSVGHLTSAQVMISRFVGSSPRLRSVLVAQSLLGILSLPPLSLPLPPLMRTCVALSK